MRDDKDFLSYKTYVSNFFNSSNFFNFTQVEPAKLELLNNDRPLACQYHNIVLLLDNNLYPHFHNFFVPLQKQLLQR